ncbi:hypothetical protein [Desulfuromonas sp. CSMB_57]|uniref:hypothetical protein n=1 Tax=Desulfuromonas sp. CSMB_57 TaxID=2807629 RepID=UPI001CD3FE9C|nr:hypothetical protein [Desulfuromonas sp. CSMB_57]
MVKKDKVLSGMLQDEMERCERLANSLKEAISELPKGSLHKRRMRYKKKEFVYHYLKLRDGSKSVYRHVPEGEAEQLEKQINERRKKEGNLKEIKNRIKYLKKLLRL